MKKALLIDAVPGEVRAALLEEDEVVEIDIARAGTNDLLGNVYLGRVTHVDPSLQAAFLQLPDVRDAYLAARHAPPGPNRRIERRVTEGELVLVQVTKEARGEKGPEVSAHISLPGRFVVYQPFRQDFMLSSRLADPDQGAALLEAASAAGVEGGGIIRTSAADTCAEHIVAELTELSTRWKSLREKASRASEPGLVQEELPIVARILRDRATPDIAEIVVSDARLFAQARHYLDGMTPPFKSDLHVHRGSLPLFEEIGAEEAIDSTLQARLPLPGGRWIAFDRTEAMTTIDVNSGSGPHSRDQQRAALESNLAAIPVIARQLRLRRTGGLVMIDFINLDRKADRNEVENAMQQALSVDPVPTTIGGWTRLGLFELTRRRSRRPLPDVLAGPLPAAHQRPRTAETVAFDVTRRVVHLQYQSPGATIVAEVHPDVSAILERQRAALDGLTTKPVVLKSAKSDSVETFDVHSGS